MALGAQGFGGRIGEKTARGAPAVLIAPSILASDFSRLGEELRRIEQAGADAAHIDVMDGAFVPNITIGPPVIKALKASAAIPFDVHLMIECPERYLEAFAEAGADIITVHAEASVHLHRTLSRIRELGVSPAVAINPLTPLCALEEALDCVDMALIMTVNPGFGGQGFIEGSLRRILSLRRAVAASGKTTGIQVDGGIGLGNIGRAAAAGANVFVAGSSLFSATDMKGMIASMREAAAAAIDEAAPGWLG